jgi:hypothetical protein
LFIFYVTLPLGIGLIAVGNKYIHTYIYIYLRVQGEEAGATSGALFIY